MTFVRQQCGERAKRSLRKKATDTFRLILGANVSSVNGSGRAHETNEAMHDS
jgi:hypothetical protein